LEDTNGKGPNRRTLISRQSPSTVPGWVRCCRRRIRRPKGSTAIGPANHTPTL